MKLLLRSAIVLLIISSAASAQAAPPAFSTDMVVSSPRRGEQMQGKLYVSGGKVRMDMNSQGHNMSMINDGPAKLMYMIMPEQHMYMEITANNPLAQRSPKMPDVRQYGDNPCAAESEVTCKKVGSEMMNGRMCDKWEFKAKSGNQEDRTAWIDQKTHMPMRVATASGTATDFKNFKEGPQDPKLFQVPSGYQKLDMGSMMQGHPDSN